MACRRPKAAVAGAVGGTAGFVPIAVVRSGRGAWRVMREVSQGEGLQVGSDGARRVDIDFRSAYDGMIIQLGERATRTPLGKR